MRNALPWACCSATVTTGERNLGHADRQGVAFLSVLAALAAEPVVADGDVQEGNFGVAVYDTPPEEWKRLSGGEVSLVLAMIGAGIASEIMWRIAAPMVGGMITAPLLSMFVVPTVYLLLRRRDVAHGRHP